MKYGLAQEDIDKIQGVFIRYPVIEKAILYGSRAKGTFRNGSDIDLTLLGKGLTLSILFALENDLGDLMLPYKIDLSILQKIEDADLVGHIERVGVGFCQKAVGVPCGR